ncbi:hypothetical protein [Aureispira anguillae]|uniref:Outer membrane protein beta-barrel domain-containing protein n=1 Tax=Aureispira anguillae TaxID=2864201 RepID=A0A915YDS9_9BACT|nr:hypothetical protein [Aureispira anguillae]BDS11212.1 hypothetical protein AsAng_0019240 [Aureispira anguillae]
MKKAFLIIILLIPFILSAQELKKKNSINAVTGIAIGSGVGQYYRGESELSMNLGPSSNSNYPKTISFAPNYRFGLDYQRALIPRLFAKAGIRFSNWNLKTINDTNESAMLETWNVEIPLAFQYHLGQKKWSPYIEGGINAIIGLAYHDNMTSLSLAAHIGLGLSYQASDRISVYGQLSSRAHFIPKMRYIEHEQTTHIAESGLMIFPYEIGMELGAAFHF